ncbi:MAG: monovalent cation/H(+) antiporter subunit G [Candidatus Competibacteraceae bacterium]|nr:monovalent cation/H(+) antiporter subunit G [Candidatus Competibacteraceae bacterium]
MNEFTVTLADGWATVGPWLAGLGQWPGLVLVSVGTLFFLAGTVGLIRFPDLFTRLHALTKADNLGLGLIALGLAWESGSWTVAVRVLLIWLLVLLAASVSCHLIANRALGSGPRTAGPPDDLSARIRSKP